MYWDPSAGVCFVGLLGKGKKAKLGEEAEVRPAELLSEQVME
jgi:hypothetical protein